MPASIRCGNCRDMYGNRDANLGHAGLFPAGDGVLAVFVKEVIRVHTDTPAGTSGLYPLEVRGGRRVRVVRGEVPESRRPLPCRFGIVVVRMHRVAVSFTESFFETEECFDGSFREPCFRSGLVTQSGAHRVGMNR